MAALSERKIDIVRTLVEAAPDAVVGNLAAALADATGDNALAGVRKLVEIEASDRRVRNAVLQPIAPLCSGDGSDPTKLTFPTRVLALLWRALREEAPIETSQAATFYADADGDESVREMFNDLARRAADGLRSGAGEYKAAVDLCEAARPGGVDMLCQGLDLGPIVRRATLRIGDWISRTTDENAASARLAYKDASALSEDAGPCFFEMLAAQLVQPWMVLRIISLVMDHPTEKYLSGSELASFATRLMDEVDAGLARLGKFDLDGGPEAGRRAGKLVELITLQVAELEGCIQLSREGPWGMRVAKQKKTLAATVEQRLRDAEKTATAALPTQSARLAKILKSVPRLADPADPKTVNRALTLLTFAEEIRSSANHGGFASARAKMVEKLGEMLDHYVEEVLDRLRSHEVEDEAIAYEFLAIAADFNGLVRDQKAAEIVRRRAAAAHHAAHSEAEPG